MRDLTAVKKKHQMFSVQHSMSFIAYLKELICTSNTRIFNEDTNTWLFRQFLIGRVKSAVSSKISLRNDDIQGLEIALKSYFAIFNFG